MVEILFNQHIPICIVSKQSTVLQEVPKFSLSGLVVKLSFGNEATQYSCLQIDEIDRIVGAYLGIMAVNNSFPKYAHCKISQSSMRHTCIR